MMKMRLGILCDLITGFGYVLGCLAPCRRLSSKSNLTHRLQQMKGGCIHLKKDITSGIASIVINNQQRMNALTGDMMVDFDNCVRELESFQQGRGVILIGSHGTFCSGGDLNTVRKITTDGVAMETFAYVQDTASRLFSLPMISVAVIDGYALGGGAELATACDFRIMTSSAMIGFIHPKLNIGTAFGGSTRLVQLVGRTTALQILISGKIMTAEEAYRVGLVNDIIEGSSSTEETGRQWLLKYLNCHSSLLGLVKQHLQER